MTVKNAVIIGAGFAGLSAARFFSNHRDLFDVTVIDRNETTQFRPLFPDIVSRTVSARHLIYPISAYSDRYGFRFVHNNVSGIDFEKRRVSFNGCDINFDYCIIAVGSQTPPPSERLRVNVARFDTIEDAGRIRLAVERDGYERIIVCGGGYTGVELAFHIRKLIAPRAGRRKVIIVEMMDRIIGTLPAWMQEYVRENAGREGVEIRLGAGLEEIRDREARLSTGEIIRNSLCIWTTGLAAPPVVAHWDAPKEHAGRIAVDQALRFREHCFAVGDVACVNYGRRCPRMSVQFALDQGALAARNILAHAYGEAPACFKSRDPGFIVPMVNGRSCGEVFGIRVKGFPATMLHYLLSVYRAPGLINRAGIAAGLLRIRASGLKGGRPF